VPNTARATDIMDKGQHDATEGQVSAPHSPAIVEAA